MYNSSDEEDACEATTKPNAFDVLMQPPTKKAKVVDKVDPIVIAVIYIRWLKWIGSLEPLYMLPYIGQAVRSLSTAKEVALARWKEENRRSTREDKDVGLIHCLDVYGPEAFDDQIIEWKRGPRSEVQAWANEREIALINMHGGPLRDPSVRCKQTLNLTKGGKGHVSFEARDSLRTVAWMKFKSELQIYVELYGSSLVPGGYSNPSSNYRLGRRLQHVRGGTLWSGHPDESSRVKWLESLPKWKWNAMESDDYRSACADRTKKWYENATHEQRAEVGRKISQAKSTPEAKYAASVISKARVARDAAEGKKSLAERSAEWYRNATQEQLDRKAQKVSAAMSTPKARAANSERGKTMAARRAIEGKKSLTEYRKEWLENSTPEIIAAWNNKKSNSIKAAIAARRAKVLEGLSGLEKKKQKAKYDRTDRSNAIYNEKVNALRKLPQYAMMNNELCKRNMAKARKEGVVFSQDSSGVWHAHMSGGSQGMGSSGEHAYS